MEFLIGTGFNRAFEDGSVRDSRFFHIPAEHNLILFHCARGRGFGDWPGVGEGTAELLVFLLFLAAVHVQGSLPQNDIVLSVSLTPPGGATPEQWINPAAFAIPAKGQWGNAGRNLARAPDCWQLDASLNRSIQITERLNLQFRAEGFNLFNRAQYGSPLAKISAPSTFGRIATLINNGPTGSGTPRQFQFALRLGF